MKHFKLCIFFPLSIFLSIFYLSFSFNALAETYDESITSAIAHATTPSSVWLPPSSPGSSIITIVGGGQSSENSSYGIKYDATDTKVIARTLSKQQFWITTSSTTKAPGEDYNIVGTIASASGAFVTVGNDMTKFLDTNKGSLTGSDVTKLLERGLGMNNDGSHNATIEYAVGPATTGYINDNLIRPTKRVDMSTYISNNPSDFTDGGAFLAKPANMLQATYDDFKTFFTNFRNNAYSGGASKFPFTQFGYTYFWDNGGSTLSEIQGMSEFVILPNQNFSGTVLGNNYGTVTVYGIYPTQSYIYTRNDGTNLSTTTGSEYGNGFASFDVNGTCDTIWAGHRFQTKIKTDLTNNNKIKIANGSSLSGGQGILVWSLNYEIENRGTISGATTVKWGEVGTDDIAILFKGDTTVYSALVPVPTSGNNTVNNYGEISTSATGTAIKIESGNSVIANYHGGTISGLTAIDSSTAGGTISITNRGTISGDIDLNAATTATLDVGNSALTINNGYVSTLNLSANSATNFGKITTTGTLVNAATSVGVTIGGYIPNNATFKVVDTGATGITAVPSVISSSSPIFNFSGDKTTGDLILTATRANSYNSYASNPDASAAGAVLNNLAINNTATGDMQTVLGNLDSLTSGDEIAQSLNSMVPEVDAGVFNNTTSSLYNFVGASIDRANEVLNVASSDLAKTGISSGDEINLNGIWGKGYGSYLTQGTRKGVLGYDAWNAGTAIGIDHLFNDNITLGLSGGYAYGKVFSDANSGRTVINSGQGTVYGGYQDKKYPYFIDAAGSFAWNWYDGKRDVNVGTAINRQANAAYDGQQYGAYIGGGYNFDLGNNVKLTPLASLQYSHLRLEGYTERGAGSMNLTTKSQNYNLLQSGVGAGVSYSMKSKYGVFTPEAHGKWLYDFMGDDMAMTSTFNGGGASFNSNGCKPAQSSFNAGGKLSFDMDNNVSLVGTCDTEIKDQFFGIYGSVAVRYSF